MNNKIKMKLFLDKDNKMRKILNLEKPLPNELINNNIVFIAKEDPLSVSKIHNDIVYLTPSKDNQNTPFSFDIQFITGIYAGLMLRNIQPTKIENNENLFLKSDYHIPQFSCSTSNNNMPNMLEILSPNYDANTLYHFHIGEYQSMPMNIDMILNLYIQYDKSETTPTESIIQFAQCLNNDEELLSLL